MRKKKRILLLEDEESVSRGISFTLEKEGYAVVSCESVAQACRTFDVFDPQLMICDITLPDGSGLEAVRYARERSSVHIICLTALDGEIDQVMGYESGADDYVTKPFSLSVLTLKIRAFFSRQEGNFADIAEYGKLKIDLTSMKIWNGEDEISLTKILWRSIYGAFAARSRRTLPDQSISKISAVSAMSGIPRIAQREDVKDEAVSA